MLDLIEKIGNAKQGSRELSDEVLLMLGWKGYTPAQGGLLISHWTDPNGEQVPSASRPDPTRNLHDAEAIIHPALDYLIGRSDRGATHHARICDVACIGNTVPLAVCATWLVFLHASKEASAH